MDEFTKSVLEKHTQLMKELDSINQRKLLIENQLKGLVVFLQSSEASNPTLTPAQVWPFPTKMVPTRVFLPRKEIIGDRVSEMLKAQQPQHARSLLAQLADEGITMTGSDPVVSLSNILSRDDRFIASRKDGWSLR